MPEAVTRGAIFDDLVAAAQARIVRLVREETLARDDGEFLLRALIDLECDGIVLFGSDRAVDADFYTAVTEYLVARVGPVAGETPVLPSVSELLHPTETRPSPRDLDRAVLQLISH
jgi:hypothetical protein